MENGLHLPHDIEGSITVVEATNWSLIIGLTVAAFLLMALVWRWWKRRKPKAVVEETLEAKIRRRLDALANVPEEAGLRLRQWSAELSEVVRLGAEVRWQIPATERTNHELKELLRGFGGSDGTQTEELLAVLNAAELVQFADARFSSDQLRELHQRSKRLIDWMLEPRMGAGA